MVKEISGDIGPNNPLSLKEKLIYLGYNFIRGALGGFSRLSTRAWKGRPVSNGSDSPARTYIDGFILAELPVLVPKRSIRVLDIGCGTGYMRELLERAGFSGEYVGVDVYEDVEFSVYESKVFTSTLICAPIADAALSGEFDLVISNTALEHISDDREAVRRGQEVLVPGGIAIHIVPSFWALFLYLFHGYRQYSRKSLHRLFKGADSSVFRLGGVGTFLLHLCAILIPERFLGTSIRGGRWYPIAMRYAYKLDRLLPAGSSMYGVVLRKPESMQKRKVLFMLPSLSQGGIESQLLSQLAVYDRTKFSLAVLTLFTYPNAPSLVGCLPEDVKLYEAGFQRTTDSGAWRRVIASLTSFNPDVVVSSMFSANTLSRILKPFFGYVSIAREHNIYDEKTRFQRFTDRILSRISWKVIAVSGGIADFVVNETGVSGKRLKVIPNGVQLQNMRRWQKDQSRASLRESLGFVEDEKVFLTVGRLKHWKNHRALINAFERILQNNDRCRLVMVGYGEERERIEMQLASINSPRITLVQASGHEVWKYYAAADWFVLASIKEGFPNVVLEALTFGLPVITTPVPGAVDCIINEYNGFMMGYDEASMATVLNSAVGCSAETYADMAKHAATTANRYDISIIAKEYEKCFTDATNVKII